jgi:hypothetical protein
VFGFAGSLIGDVWSRNPENLYMELAFLSAIESTTFDTPPAIVGARQVDMSVLPDTTRKVYFVATLQSMAAAAVAHVELWDVTHDVMVASADLDNSAAVDPFLAETFVSGELTEGSSAGNIRTDVAAEYEVRLYRSGGLGTDYVAVLNAYLRVVFD